jgi:alkyl sulfatase BDS1-like metallo-beta-lactamase superfamily hydrolase
MLDACNDKRFLTQRRTFGADAGMSPDTIKAMPTEMTFDYFTVRLNGEKAAGGLNRLLSNKKPAWRVRSSFGHRAHRLLIELRKGMQASKRGTRCSAAYPLEFPGARWR